MGRDLYLCSPAAKAIFDFADFILGFSLSRLCFEGPDEELKKTVNAQPAILTVSIACLAAASETGRLQTAEYMAGHSLGEYSALMAAGALDFSTALNLTRERGRMMYEASLHHPGGMAAIISISKEMLDEICHETGAFIANLNCPGQIVISGTLDAINETIRYAKIQGAKLAIPLAVSGAFHSPLMQSAAIGLKQVIQKYPLVDTPIASNMLWNNSVLATNHLIGKKVEFDLTPICTPSVSVVGNVYAQPLHTPDDVRNELIEQVCQCVQWERTMQYLLLSGVDTFVEIGPGEVLTGFLGRIDRGVKSLSIGKMDDIESLTFA